ncbi:PTS galactitol transporter subunit IIB [Histophilus somni]|uniref:PTS system galactitol-specific EIIB component, Gat family n=1 Tax=Histophilus somni (strain 129Pt) TaxID=205914 RepID=Q0I403_HISS1|nr:PTS galactitol transporter subunit IIB [Histophilus somni]
MKKKVIVACGGAVATSTLAAEEIEELCAENNISLELVQCRVNEIGSYINDADLICTTAKISQTYGDIPIVHGMPFVSGVGIDELKEKILVILRG